MENENNKNSDFEKKHLKVASFVDNLKPTAKKDQLVRDINSLDKDSNIEGRIYSFSKKPRRKLKFFLIFVFIIVLFLVFSYYYFFMMDTNIDSDGDGIIDSKDLFPNKDAKVKFTFKGLEYLDVANLTSSNTIYYSVFEVFNLNWETFVYDKAGDSKSDYPSSKTYNTYTFEDIILNVSDNASSHTFIIQFYEYDSSKQQHFVLDVDDDESMGLTLEYDIVSGSWKGDDITGISDGSKDNLPGEKDCYLEYFIETI